MANGYSKKVANTLMIVSSAAVLAVFSAGYVRTQPAADRVERQALARESARQIQPTAAAPGTNIPLPAATPAPTAPKVAVHHEPKPPKLVAMHVASPASVQAPVEAEAPAPVAAYAPAPVAPVVEQQAEIPVPAPAPAPAQPAATAWKDGKYTGWGNCFHGDIQATVVIASGRIASAEISQCLTRYDCDVIAKLPPQVVMRQSNNVDRISGATQSSDAFYYAVLDALNQAK